MLIYRCQAWSISNTCWLSTQILPWLGWVVKYFKADSAAVISALRLVWRHPVIPPLAMLTNLLPFHVTTPQVASLVMHRAV